MTLKAALKAFILQQVPDTGPVFMGEIVDNDEQSCYLIRDAGSWGNDPTGCWLYPTIELTVRAEDQDLADSRSVQLFHALNTGRRLQLAPGYTVLRSQVPSPPESEGRDPANRWIRRIDCNFLTHAAAAL